MGGDLPNLGSDVGDGKLLGINSVMSPKASGNISAANKNLAVNNSLPAGGNNMLRRQTLNQGFQQTGATVNLIPQKSLRGN